MATLKKKKKKTAKKKKVSVQNGGGWVNTCGLKGRKKLGQTWGWCADTYESLWKHRLLPSSHTHSTCLPLAWGSSEQQQRHAWARATDRQTITHPAQVCMCASMALMFPCLRKFIYKHSLIYHLKWEGFFIYHLKWEQRSGSAANELVQILCLPSAAVEGVNSRLHAVLDCSPDLFCIVEFDLRPLLDEFGVLLQVFDAPLCMLLQVVKLILQDGREEISPSEYQGGKRSFDYIAKIKAKKGNTKPSQLLFCGWRCPVKMHLHQGLTQNLSAIYSKNHLIHP